MHRFFVQPEAITGDNVSISGMQARQIARVLRLKPGDRIAVLDDTGWEYEVLIGSSADDTVTGEIVHRERGTAEPAVTILLYQALIKADRFEFVLQKGVELGVTCFWPFISERCVTGMPSESKLERWRAVIREAAEQSGRVVLPALYPPIDFELACKDSPVPGIILWEGEKNRGISTVLKSHAFKETELLRVFVGPEGGFTSAEIELARRRGIVPVGLGKRILRTETAGLVAVSAIMYEKGELG
ncbi:MAG: RsmE family RNA methyltransferase [Dehalococcoidia bacterium]|nr:RsmE family RNA methyltransferase [Dehalococcoidia bacterium]